jgi:hypothetical protein
VAENESRVGAIKYLYLTYWSPEKTVAMNLMYYIAGRGFYAEYRVEDGSKMKSKHNRL